MTTSLTAVGLVAGLVGTILLGWILPKNWIAVLHGDRTELRPSTPLGRRAFVLGWLLVAGSFALQLLGQFLDDSKPDRAAADLGKDDLANLAFAGRLDNGILVADIYNGTDWRLTQLDFSVTAQAANPSPFTLPLLPPRRVFREELDLRPYSLTRRRILVGPFEGAVSVQVLGAKGLR